MVYCPKCGTENIESATYCTKCGNQLKAEEKELEDKKDLKSSIELKAIILGGAVTLALFILSVAAIALTIDDIPLAVVPLIFFIIFVGGLVTGYLSKDYSRSAIINGAIIGILMTLVFGLLQPIIFLIGLLFFVPFSILGGYIGYLIKKRTINN